MRTRVLLVQPAPFQGARPGLESVIWLSEPVALTSLAGSIEVRHDVRILDLRLERPSALREELARFRPHIVGVSSMTTDVYNARRVAYETKLFDPNILTVIGGHHPTMCYDEFHLPFLDAIALGEAEETFAEICDLRAKTGEDRWDRDFLLGVRGIVVNTTKGQVKTPARPQIPNLDDLPLPARHLLKKRGYTDHYFFTAAKPLASMFTSRGCAYDCNFCAIWEFYERKVRYLSAKRICDQLELMPEKFVFFLDDNFLTSDRRLEELHDEMKRRKIDKFWMSQGRSDAVVSQPELVKKLRDVGMRGLLSGYETNDQEKLAFLRKRNSVRKNELGANILAELGIFSTGIFMVRPDFEKDDFQMLYEYMDSLRIAVPIVTIWTPLPGTQLYREKKDELITDDLRLYDLLHAVVETKLPREEFYKNFCQSQFYGSTSMGKALTSAVMLKNGSFWAAMAKSIPEFVYKRQQYKNFHYDYRNYLRDEEGRLRPSRSSTLASKKLPLLQVSA
jgi:radical SAM superfamily enzyme YgiQ (UPF0313 family)